MGGDALRGSVALDERDGRRLKNGKPSVHQIGGEELRALKRDDEAGPFVFMTIRGAPMPGSESFSRGSVSRRVCRSRSTCTCCGARPGTSWRTSGRTRAPCSTTSGTRTSCTPCATPSCSPNGSRISRRIECEIGR